MSNVLEIIPLGGSGTGVPPVFFPNFTRKMRVPPAARVLS